MRKLLVCLAAIVCVAALSTVAHAQCGVLGVECLVNGTLDIGTAGGAGLPGTAPPWTLTNTGDPTAAQFNPGFANSVGPGGNGIWYRAFLGGPTQQNPNRPLVSADLSQTAVATAAGRYLLLFDYLVETNFTAESMMATLSSTGGGTSTLNLLTVPRTNVGGGFVDNPAGVGSLLVNANAGDTLTVHLAMVNGRDAGTNPQSVVADNFRLARIPEPTSVLLGLIGVVGLLGLARRR
jgi:hypothetical protein